MSWYGVMLRALRPLIGFLSLTLFTAISSLALAAEGPAMCSDFLLALNRKPQTLEFVACQETVKHGLASLEAKYRVTGGDAAAVEAYLVKTARMPRLRYICCGWETLPRDPKTQRLTGVYRHKGERYDIAMASGEVTINQRSRWREISSFYVTATRFIELP